MRCGSKMRRRRGSTSRAFADGTTPTGDARIVARKLTFSDSQLRTVLDQRLDEADINTDPCGPLDEL
jgi:hypothetical protein